MEEAKNGFAVFESNRGDGYSVIPENILWIFSQPSVRTVTRHPFLNLLLIFRQQGNKPLPPKN